MKNVIGKRGHYETIYFKENEENTDRKFIL